MIRCGLTASVLKDLINPKRPERRNIERRSLKGNLDLNTSHPDKYAASCNPVHLQKLRLQDVCFVRVPCYLATSSSEATILVLVAGVLRNAPGKHRDMAESQNSGCNPVRNARPPLRGLKDKVIRYQQYLRLPGRIRSAVSGLGP